MKKQLTMSLEMARIIYKNLIDKESPTYEGICLMSILEENFTKEELNPFPGSITIDNSEAANITTTNKLDEGLKEILDKSFVRKTINFEDKNDIDKE